MDPAGWPDHGHKVFQFPVIYDTMTVYEKVRNRAGDGLCRYCKPRDNKRVSTSTDPHLKFQLKELHQRLKLEFLDYLFLTFIQRHPATLSKPSFSH